MKFSSHCWLRAGESRFALILIMPPDLVYVHVHKARVSRRFYFVLIFKSISSATSNSCLDQESRIVLENNFFIRKMMEAFLLSSVSFGCHITGWGLGVRLKHNFTGEFVQYVTFHWSHWNNVSGERFKVMVDMTSPLLKVNFLWMYRKY